MFSRSEEIKCQREALEIISHGDDKIVQELFKYHNMILAITFRSVINDFEKEFDRCPTGNELISIASKVLKEDIREIF